MMSMLGATVLAHDGAEQLLLVLEIEIERALRHAGAPGDFVQLGGGEALFREHLERRGANLARAGLPLAFASAAASRLLPF